MFNLSKMKSSGGAGSGLAAPSAASVLASRDVGVSMVEKRPSSGVEAGLRKRLQKAAAEQSTDASGSIARSSADKGKGTVEIREAPEQGYIMRELCKVENQARADRYFTSIMTRLKGIEGEDPLVSRWSTISRSSLFWIEGPLSREYLRRGPTPRPGEVSASISQELAATAERRAKELEAKMERMRIELESLRSQRRELEQEVRLLRSSLDGARNDRAHLEGDVLSLTEAVALLEAELKTEG
ncbi:hypothetical protein BHM03_00026239 [Ensete ventricosum]|nr:hypothetical protein BHM03_00026239 [Ensete ventricosum]